MKSLHDTLFKIRGLSLKLKLLIPFLFFAFSSTSILTIISMTSQQNLIKKEERNLISQHYKYFMERIKQREQQSISIASSIAEIPNVESLLAKQDRNTLYDLLKDPYKALQKNNDLSQFHFHIPPGISFLRLHKPEQYGDKIDSYRKSVADALKGLKPSACLDRGATGLSIRGVVPIYHEGSIAGSIEIGFSFGKTFVDDFYNSWKINTALYEVENRG